MSEKRIAVVTGANRGIGREIARRLVTSGLDVVATARDADAHVGGRTAPADGRASAADVGARYVPLDVTKASSIDALARDLPEGVDVLVNNAGVSMNGFDAEVARRTLDVNFFGAM